eukprot:4816011-Prymnesium_polylepis.1
MSLGLSPIPTQAIVAGFQLMATLGNFVLERLGRRIGAMGAIVLFSILGCMALAVVALAADRTVVIVALLVRGALMNATTGLTGSVLNDHIPKEKRARWNMAQQVRLVTWSGSAFAGGAIIDAIGYRPHDVHHLPDTSVKTTTAFIDGYRTAFLCCLGFHTVATLCLMPLVPLVPPKR